ncbi:putative transmembrane protein [Senna tora]|uniref:Putative transmembrane protein n=1 Tax=Senna tora TaxID=362788 RepID=A0A834WCB1_9FABA|nr:putative transmembrane protein [Senna tora]
MGLEVEWYDFVCFGIIGVAVIGALWVLWVNETVSRSDYDSIYESLLVARPDNEVVNILPRGHVSTSQLWTSCWRGLHPLCLFATRFTSFLVMAVLLIWDLVQYGASTLYYYTEWTWTLVMIYFALGSLVSAYGCWCYLKPPQNGTQAEFHKRDLECEGSMPKSRSTEEEFQQRAGFLDEFSQKVGLKFKLIFWIEQICAGAVVLTDIVFWCVIVPFMKISHLDLNPLTDCMHSLNAVFLLVDTALNSLPFPWFRIAYFVLWSCAYIIFQWVVHACGLISWWPYPFIVLNSPWAPVWYLCLAVVHIPCYGLYALIVIAKDKIFARLFPRAFLRPY